MNNAMNYQKDPNEGVAWALLFAVALLIASALMSCSSKRNAPPRQDIIEDASTTAIVVRDTGFTRYFVYPFEYDGCTYLFTSYSASVALTHHAGCKNHQNAIIVDE